MGTVPDWISALATLGALVAAWIAGSTAKRLYDMESKRDDVATEQRERRTADLVHAWSATIDGKDPKPTYGVLISNSSTTPVFDLVVHSNTGIKAKDGGRICAKPVSVALLPPGHYFVTTTPESDRRGHDDQIPVPTRYLDGDIRPVMKDPAWVVTELSFTDATGRHWRRDRTGILTRQGATPRR